MFLQKFDLFSHMVGMGWTAAYGRFVGRWTEGLDLEGRGVSRLFQVLQIQCKYLNVIMCYLVIVAGILRREEGANEGWVFL
jgi:hypothetical protein